MSLGMPSAFVLPMRIVAPLAAAVTRSDWARTRELIQNPSGPGPWTPEFVMNVALQFAVMARSRKQFVKGLVDFMPPDSLNIRDILGRTALHAAAMVGGTEAVKILVEKSSILVHRVDKNNELPIHLAARHAHKETVQYLFSVTDNEDLEGGELYGEAGARLLKLLIISDFYDIAFEVLKRCLHHLSPSHSPLLSRLLLEEPLEMLVARPEAFARLQRYDLRWFCYICLPPLGFGEWENLLIADRTLFKYPHASDLLSRLMEEIVKRGPPTATEILGGQLFSAVRCGNHEAAIKIVIANSDVMLYRNEDGHGFLELAVLNRQERILYHSFHLGPHIKECLLQKKDRDGNNMLHLAARRQPSSASSAALQVQRDWQWFKEIEKFVLPTFRNQKNNAGKSPREVFAEQHEKLLEEGDKWMKKTAESCTVVAALVVTVVFAAAFTVPGGNNDSNGIPNYLTDAAFMTFAISDTLGLVSSTTSLLMFLSILSSRFSEMDLLNTGQYTRLSIGLVTLFFSIASMLVTFTASLQIVLGHRVSWIAVPIGILTSVPVILFALLQFPLLVEIVYSTFRPIFCAGEKVKLFLSSLAVFCRKK